MLWAQSATKDYIRTKHKLQSISKLFIPQVIIPQVFLPQTIAQFLSTISERKTRKTITHVLEPIYFLARTQHGNLHPAGWPILFCGPTQEPVLATANKGKTWERFGKNADEWTGRVEISKEEIPGSKRSKYDYITTSPGVEGRTFKALCS